MKIKKKLMQKLAILLLCGVCFLSNENVVLAKTVISLEQTVTPVTSSAMDDTENISEEVATEALDTEVTIEPSESAETDLPKTSDKSVQDWIASISEMIIEFFMNGI